MARWLETGSLWNINMSPGSVGISVPVLPISAIAFAFAASSLFATARR
jgi:hypothetical protein